jgi:type II secretory pathway component PulC
VAAENFKVKKGLEVGTGITANSDGIDVTGIVTATQFQGDGSGLIGVVASGVGVIVKDEGSTVGTAGTINFVGSGVAAAISEGTATVTVGVSTANVVTDSLVVAGVATATSFESTVSTGTAPFVVASSTKVTNLNADILDDKSTANGAVGNSVVVRNAAAGFSANDVNFQSIVGTALSVAGITTFSDDIHFHGATGITSITYDKSANELRFKDNVRLKFGNSNDLHIYHSGSGSVIREQGTGDLVLTAQDLILQNVTNGATMGQFVAGGAVKLFFNGQQKFTTTGSGIEVPDLSVTGVGTIGRVDVNGLVFGTNATTFAAKFPDSAVANFGGNNELQISHATNISRIQSDNDILYLKGLGINFYKGNSSELFAKFVDDEQVELYYNGSKTFETTGVGASCVGIMSATSFVKTGGTSSQFLMADGSTSAGGGGGGGVTVKDEGSALSTTGTTLNFVGSGVVASGTGAEKTITIAGGSSQNVFSTIAVSGQSNVVADSATDTLTFAAGSNVTLTTNAGTDTVTIAAANDNTQLSNEQVQDIVGAMFSGNTETDITATYEDADGTIDLVVDLSSLNANNLDSGTIPNGRFPTTLPVVSGANLTSLNASEITSGTLPIARIADNAVTFAKMQDVGTGVLIGRNGGGSGDMETLSASEVRTLLNVADGATAGITTAASNFQVTFEILSTSSNSNGYRFSGPGNDGADPNPDLYLVRGQKYRFINNSGGLHPFQIQSSAGGSAYNTGVENNGANSGNIDFNVQHDAPTRLYYQCTSHGGMIGNIYITGGASWQTTDVNTSTTEEIFTLLNVGVGTDNALARLDVYKGTSATDVDIFSVRSKTGAFNIQCSDTDAANPEWRLRTYSSEDIVFSPGGTGSSAEKVRIASNGRVGIGTATPAQKLDVDGTIRFGTSNISSGTHTFTASAGSAVTADSTAVGNATAIEYTIFISNGSNIQSQKVLIMDNGTTAYSQEFAMMSNPNMIATFSADVNSGNVRLRATPETGISGSTTIKFSKLIIE